MAGTLLMTHNRATKKKNLTIRKVNLTWQQSTKMIAEQIHRQKKCPVAEEITPNRNEDNCTVLHNRRKYQCIWNSLHPCRLKRQNSSCDTTDNGILPSCYSLLRKSIVSSSLTKYNLFKILVSQTTWMPSQQTFLIQSSNKHF